MVALSLLLSSPITAEFAREGFVREIRSGGVLLAEEARLWVAAPGWKGLWGAPGTRTSRVTETKPLPGGLIVKGEFAGGPKLLWEAEMRREAGRVVYRCRVRAAKGEVVPGAVLIRVTVPVVAVVGRKYLFLYPQRVVEGRFPRKLPPDYILWRRPGFDALIWEAEGGKFLLVRPLSGLRHFQLQDNRKFGASQFEAQFYAGNVLSADRWTEVAVSFEAPSEEEVGRLVDKIRRLQRRLKEMLRSRGPLEIRKVEVLTKSPRAHRKVELRLDISGTWDNPFDPDQVDIWAEIEPPAGRAYRIPAFFYLPCERRREGEGEAILPAGEPDFRVRFLPTAPGVYKVRITARDRTGATASRALRVEVGPGRGRGFVRVDERDGTRFRFDDGTPLFLIGHNVCWLPSTFLYEEYFDRMSEAGENYTRLWIGPFDIFTLERAPQVPDDPFGLGRYDLFNAWRLDKVVELAERKGILLMLCIESFNSLRPARMKHGMWERCPYNAKNGGPCKEPEDFFTNPEAKRLFKRRLRYMVARWAYSPAVMAWEFWNEVDITYGYDSKAVAQWHREMARYLRGLDPYDHLITTSYARSDGDPAVDGLPELDYVQTHNYGSPDIAEMVSKWHDFKARYGKPHYLGEFGMSASGGPYGVGDPEGVHLHNGLWAALSCGDAGTAMLWWWDIYIHRRNLYHHFTSLSKFLRAVGVPEPPVRRLDNLRISYPKPTKFADLLIPTVAGSWKPAPWNRPNTVEVLHDGTLRPSRLVPRVIHGTVNHPDLHNPITFLLDCPSDCEFTVHIEGVSGWGGAGLTVKVDGKVVLRRDFPDPDGLRSTETIHKYDGPYTVKLTKGRHAVTVENHGKDWFFASFTVTRYREPLRAFGISARNALYIWVQHVQSTWWHVERGEGPLPVEGAVLRIPLPEGSYEVLLWDTWAGRTVERLRLRARGGALSLLLPRVERDLAVAVLRR